jgi:hypothetical protein
MSNPVLGLDADNVLRDYSTACARPWERAFDAYPVERDPGAYWPIDHWGFQRLVGGAPSGEHMSKASDLRLLFGRGRLYLE